LGSGLLLGSRKSFRGICELGWAAIQRGRPSSEKSHLEINVSALGSLQTQWYPIIEFTRLQSIGNIDGSLTEEFVFLFLF
jgi:hypothetical protein